MKTRKVNQKGYTHYVFNTANNKIVSGWEFQNDAKDDLKERSEWFDVSKCRVFTKRHVLSLNVDPDVNENWKHELPQLPITAKDLRDYMKANYGHIYVEQVEDKTIKAFIASWTDNPNMVMLADRFSDYVLSQGLVEVEE